MNDTPDDAPQVAAAPNAPRRRGRPRAPKNPAQDVVRALLDECLSRDLLRATDIAERFDVHKATVSRFKSRLGPFPPSKLAGLEGWLRDVASSRIVFPPRPRDVQRARRAKETSQRAEDADALLAFLPPAILAQFEQVEALGLGDPGMDLVQRAILLLAMHRCGANMTAAGELLNASRKSVAHAWTTLEAATPVSTPRDPRDIEERARRERLAAELLEPIPPIVRIFAQEVVDALPASVGSKLTFARNLLSARALRHRGGEGPRSPQSTKREGLARPPEGKRASWARSVRQLMTEVPFVEVPGRVARLLERMTPDELVSFLEPLTRSSEGTAAPKDSRRGPPELLASWRRSEGASTE